MPTPRSIPRDELAAFLRDLAGSFRRRAARCEAVAERLDAETEGDDMSRAASIVRELQRRLRLAEAEVARRGVAMSDLRVQLDGLTDRVAELTALPPEDDEDRAALDAAAAFLAGVAADGTDAEPGPPAAEDAGGGRASLLDEIPAGETVEDAEGRPSAGDER